MKTIAKISKEIPFVITMMEAAKKDNKRQQITSLKRQIANLNTAVNYLKTKPKKSFIEKQRDTIKNRIDAYMKEFKPTEGQLRSIIQKEKREYEKEMGIKPLRAQLRFLNYLLDD